MNAQTIAIIVSALLAVSEAMALIPSLKDNGILQMVIRVLKGFVTTPAVTAPDAKKNDAA